VTGRWPGYGRTKRREQTDGGRFDTRTALGRAFMQIAAVFAELELSRLRERTKAVLDQKRANGYLPGTLTYGWDAEATGEVSAKGTKLRRVKPNVCEQRQLRRMLHLRARGRSWYAIAKALNAAGVRTKQGHAWAGGTVRKLLNSRTFQDWRA